VSSAAAAPQAGVTRVVLALGTAQTLAWASSYYISAILAGPMARDFGIAASWVFGAFSAALVVFGGPAAMVFAVLHGMGNGVLTIAKGTLPLAVFGPAGYGARLGWLGAPARMLQANAPFLFGLLLEAAGVSLALALTAGLSLAACAALLALRTAR
jgi:hypothetical protein